MLIVFATFIVLSAAAPDSSAHYSTSRFETRHKSDSPCKTPECINAASMLLKSIDQSVDPCDDFYQFACGKYFHNITKSSIISSFITEIEKQMRLGMEEGMKEDPDVFNLMKSFYNTCMNAEQKQHTAAKDLRKMLKNLGGWPVLEGSSWNETTFDWKKSVHEIGKMGFNDKIFVSVDIVTDNYNSSRRIIQINEADTYFNARDVMNETNSDFVRYSRDMIKLAVSLGADQNQAEKELSDSLNFEIELSKICTTHRENLGYHIHQGKRMTLQQLEINFSGIPWGNYINGVMAPHIHIDSNDEMIVESPHFIQAFTKLITNTPKRTIANYALWRVVRRSADIIYRFNGTSCSLMPYVCLHKISNYFDVASSSFYVQRYFDESARTNALTMVKNIKNSVHQLINQAEWMDDASKRQALEKLNAMKLNVGYPNELVNNENLNVYYKNLKLYSESYLKSVLSLNRFKREKEFSSLKESVQKTFWITLSKDVTRGMAWSYQENVISIQAGALRGNFYNKDRPNYMNYGRIGWIISHEVTHAFDNQGSLFDKNGNLVNWWKNETREKYLEKAKCIIEQYSNYYIKEINMTLNGTYTQGENIADNVGLKASYYAYNQMVKDNGKESRLPELYYTPQQLFWISAATTSCRKITTKMLEYIKNDVRAPTRLRVIGTLSNIPEFSKDFQCPLGSRMNPAKKCSVW